MSFVVNPSYMFFPWVGALPLAFVFGACVGSFLNVVTLRTHAGTSFVRGRSQCPACHRSLGGWELIPIIGFLLLRGQCRTCKAKISPQYPLVEAIGGLLFVASVIVWFLGGWSWPWLVRALVASSFLLLLSVYDTKYGELPDQFTLPAAVVFAALSLWITRDPGSVFLGALIGAGWFWIQHVVSQGRWVGDGDSRLGLALGALVGFPLVVVGLGAAYISASLFAIPLLITGRVTKKSRIPFGPFLALGAWFALLFWPFVSVYF